ncbi:MAG: glycosyltransferase family 4 protein [Ignavibacteria bacterium]
MKINFIVPEISRTGGMRVIFEYANRLKSRGHDVILYSPIIPFNNYRGMIKRYYIRYRINSAKAFILDGRKIPENIYKKKFDIKFLWVFNNFTVRNADVSVATSWPTSYIVHKLNSSKGKKLYLIQDYEKWNSNIKYVDKSYTLPLQRITVSNYLRNFLNEKFGVDSEVILNGIDFTVFNNPSKQFSEPIKILFTDHILENKNSIAAIETIVKLKNKYPDLKIRGFGMAKYHQMPEYVEFFENPDENIIVRLYNGSDIFLYTSIYEGFGLTPAEAMACKCAVLGNKVAALPEYSEDMKSAILTSPDNKEELFNGAEYLINHNDELKRISLSGYENVRKKLDWELSVNKFEKIIAS